MSIIEKLVEIQSQLKAPKGQTNNFGGYQYRSCEDILEAVKPLAAEVGCVVLISDAIEQIGDRYYVKATATLRFDEVMALQVTAYAREPEDKKGMDLAQITGSTSSYARKYALNGLFAIDDTKDADTQKPPGNAKAGPDNRPLTKTQHGAIEATINDANADLVKFLAHYKIDSLDGMKRHQFAGAIKQLNRKIDEANKEETS